MTRGSGSSASRTDAQSYRDELRAELENYVLPAIVERLQTGVAAPAPRELARRMLAVAPAPAPYNKMAEQVGPEFYDTAGASVVLAREGSDPVSRQAVGHRRRRRTLLALQTSDRRWIYPTWQFVGGDVMPGLPAIMAVFGDQPAWSVATWLTTPRRDLEGATAVEWLRHGRDLGHLLRVARRTAARWAA
jgi:hypothetical protein